MEEKVEEKEEKVLNPVQEPDSDSIKSTIKRKNVVEDKRALAALMAIAFTWSVYLLYLVIEFLLELQVEEPDIEFDQDMTIKLMWYWIYVIAAALLGPFVIFVVWYRTN